MLTELEFNQYYKEKYNSLIEGISSLILLSPSRKYIFSSLSQEKSEFQKVVDVMKKKNLKELLIEAQSVGVVR